MLVRPPSQNREERGGKGKGVTKGALRKRSVPGEKCPRIEVTSFKKEQ